MVNIGNRKAGRRCGLIELLRVGPCPEWNQQPLDAAFAMHRYFEADNKKAFLAAVAADIRGIATRGELGAERATIDMLPKLEIVRVYGAGFDAAGLDA